MKTFRKFRFWFDGLFRRGKLNTEMAEEMQLHLELRKEKNIAAGMSAEEAGYAALREFGGLAQIKDRSRDQRGGAWLADMFQDFRYGLRTLRKNPIFTSVAVLSLALGIGAATSVFSLVDAILLGSLSVPNPQDLRVICWSGSEMHMPMYASFGDPVVPGLKAGSSFSTEIFHLLRTQCVAEADIFGYQFFDGTARCRNKSVSAVGLMVSSNFFSGLGVSPVVGSLLGLDDERNAGPPRVVLSYRFWQDQFALDPAAAGQQLVVNGNSFIVAGVLPKEFTGAKPGERPDLYTSLSVKMLLMPKMPPDSPDFWWTAIMARLKPGVTTDQFKAMLDVKLNAVAAKYITKPEALVTDGHDGPGWDREGYRNQLQLLLAVVGVVVLVASANLAGLLIARGANRQHELSIRGALGADRGRLVRQLLAESALLSLLGGGLGLLIALWGRSAVSRLLAGSSEGLHFDTTLDLKVLAFALAVTLLTAVLAGVFPALKSSGVNPQGGVKDRAVLGVPRLRVGQFLVAAQIALSLLLVAGAGLYVRTLINLVQINPGFSIDHILTFSQNPGEAGYTESRSVTYFETMQQSLSAIPGVKSVALISFPLLSSTSWVQMFTLPDRPSEGQQGEDSATVLTIGETFFSTMGIPLLAGRELRANDTGKTAKVVVVNEAFALKFFPHKLVVGRNIKLNDTLWQIVGVCGDAKSNNIKQSAEPTMFFSFRQQPTDRASFALRTMGAPLSLAPAVRKAAAAIDPNVPVESLATEEQMRNQNITSERMFAAFCGALAMLALLLSSIGLYGLMTYDVTRRTREIGIRVALGATPRELIRPILQRALALAVAGIGMGLPLTLALTRVTRANLYGVTTSDPVTFFGASILLVAVALVAAWIPVRRAARVDPLIALRCE